MIQSIWLIDGVSGDVVLEKHYKGLVGRTSVELFWEQVAKCARRDDVPPIIPTTKYYLVNIYRGGMYFLATLTGEVCRWSAVGRGVGLTRLVNAAPLN